MTRSIFFIILIIFFIGRVYSQCPYTTGIYTAWRCNFNSGTISVVVFGGVPPYTYTLDNGTPQSSGFFDNVPAGLHNITVQDAVCPPQTFGKSLTNNSNLAGLIRMDDALCGKITIEPCCGYEPYLLSVNGGTFQPSMILTGLNAGTYNFVVKDATDCVISLGPVVITTNPLAATSVKVDNLCPGTSTGSIVVTATNGTPPYSYSIDNGVSFQATNIFAGLSAGTYNLVVKDLNNCMFPLSATILNGLIGVTASATTQNAACNGSATGSITVTTATGIPPFNYSLDGVGQSSNIMTGVLPGLHSIVVTDANGCKATITATVGSNPAITASVNTTNTACSGSATGTITVTSATGISPYAYSLNSLPVQPSNIFTGLIAGSYIVHVTDGNGCSVAMPAIVDNGSGISATATSQNAVCSSSPTGRITVTASLGLPPYSYSLDGGSFQLSNIFNNILPGSHTVLVQDANSCSYSFTSLVNTNPGITASYTSQNSACPSSATGSITVTASLGTLPYSYSLDGGTFQPSNFFNNILPGNHNILVKDVNGCSFSLASTISSDPGVTATYTSQNAACSSAATGSITVTASLGTLPYSYSLDGGTFQPSNIFNNLLPGNHTILVKDVNACSFSLTSTVNIDPGVTATYTAQNAACSSAATGSITVTASLGTLPYSYSLDGGTFQPSNVFNNILAGSHSIVVKDAHGCSAQVNAIVGSNPGISATLNITNTACSGTPTGSITVTPASGISPYTYSLNSLPVQPSNIFTGLGAGSYIVHVTDGNGCSIALPAVVDNGGGISATATSQNAVCSSSPTGSITVTASLGLLPYSYSLDGGSFQVSNIFINILPGSHTILIKDANNCSYSFTSLVNTDPGITATYTSQNSACSSSATGSITITASLGTLPYSYSLDGSTFQSSNIFNSLLPGNHTILVKDVNGCSFSLTSTVNSDPGVSATYTSQNAACSSAATGSITVTASLGTLPYSYSLDGGTFQPSNIFNNILAGNHSIVVKDVNGCSTAVSAVVGSNPGINATLNITNTACSGTPTGSITVTPASGISPYTYSLNSLPVQSSNIFTGLGAGSYIVHVTDGNGCSIALPAVVDNGGGISATATSQNAVCSSSPTGSIIVIASLGLLPYSYSLDGGSFQSSNIFNNILPGSHTLLVKDANNCSYSFTSLVNTDPGITAAYTSQNSACPSSATGSITVTASLGTLPYSYSLDGGTFQSSNFFNNILPGNHNILVKDVNGCSFSLPSTVSSDPGVTATYTSQNAACSSAATGIITVTANLGTLPYSYSLDGGTFQPSNIFNNLSAGNHGIMVKDANGCSTSLSAIVGSNPGISATLNITNTACSGTPTGSITVTPASGISPYTYSLNSLPVQPSNIFTGLGAGNYTVHVTDGNGCSVSLPAVIDNGSGISATATSQNAVCSSSPTGSITVTASLGLLPYSYSLDGGSFQVSNLFINILPGSHAIIVKDANNCSYSFTSTINTDPGITATYTSQNAGCSSMATGSITVTASLGTLPYSYSLDGGSFQPSNIFNNISAGNHTILVKDANGCSYSFTPVVNSDPGVTATSTSHNAACSSIATGSIVVAANMGILPYSYSLDGGSFQSSNIFNNLLPGIHTILVKDASNCSYSFSSTVNSDPGVTATYTSQNSSCAAAASGTITVSASSGSAPYSYSLNGSAFQPSNIFTGLASGSYTIVVKDAAGCTFSGIQVVNSNAGVTANFTSVNTACGSAATGSITINASNGVSPYTYASNGGTFQSSNTFPGLGAGSYNIQVRDAAGCIFTGTQLVASDPGVTAIATATNAGCPGSSTGSITINASSGMAPYQYSLNGGPFQFTNVFGGLSANTYNIKVKDAANCVVAFTANVNSDPLVTVTLNITGPYCFGSSTGTIKINPLLGRPPYEYALNNGPYQPGNTFNNLVKGNYTVHTRDANGCIKDTSILLNEPAQLTAIADTTASTCFGNDGTITVNASGGTLPFLYSKDGVNYQSTNLFTVGPGTYNMVVKDSQGCQYNTPPAIVTLLNNMFLQVGNDTAVCFGIPVTITPVTNTGTHGFNWTPTGGNLNTLTGAYTVSPPDTTSYFLTATYGVCQRTDNININVLRKPVAYAGRDTIICDKATAFLHGSASNLSGPVSYLWSPAGDLASPNKDTTTATPATNGPHTYTFQVADNYGCNFKVADAIVVTMNPVPHAFAGNDTIAAMYLPHQLFGKGGVSYTWSPAGVLNDPNVQNPVAILSYDTKFILTVADNAGCLATDTVLVKVYEGPTYYVPNAFTPNGDGLNDVFRAIPPGIAKTDYFRIFNRWGQMVFETHQYMKGWDGTYIGKPQPNGSYVWEIKGIDKFGKVIQMKGFVILIR